MKLIHVVGARPNFMKAAPVYRAIAAYPRCEQKIIHTGQHYDTNMSDVFFHQLSIPAPDINLQVGSGTHAQQTAEIMTRFETHVRDEKPDLVLVYGDVNSTVAAALVCAKLNIQVAHVEAGLRSFDRSMPEEINRLLTDQLADLLFTPSDDGDKNLLREGIPASKIHMVGNVMIDTLVRMLPEAKKSIPPDLPEQFVLVTLHRPSNVDDTEWLTRAYEILCDLSRRIPVLFPVHPRTRQRLSAIQQGNDRAEGLRLIDPLSYLEFLGLQTRAAAVVTDSGGIQEETTYLGVPCLTLRENTERPVTVDIGTNILVGRDLERMRVVLGETLNGRAKRGSVPHLWDGRSAERIAAIIDG
jgi:UDP-N-acetylglucosamine 2-epimerase (non-hydrolysing)